MTASPPARRQRCDRGVILAANPGGSPASFADRYWVFSPERRGHGWMPDVDGPITYEIMADDTTALIDALGIGPVDVVGWSDGGNVGLIAALRRRDLIRKLVVIATAVNISGGTRFAQAMTEHTTPRAPSTDADRRLRLPVNGRLRPLSRGVSTS